MLKLWAGIQWVLGEFTSKTLSLTRFAAKNKAKFNTQKIYTISHKFFNGGKNAEFQLKSKQIFLSTVWPQTATLSTVWFLTVTFLILRSKFLDREVFAIDATVLNGLF